MWLWQFHIWWEVQFYSSFALIKGKLTGPLSSSATWFRRHEHLLAHAATEEGAKMDLVTTVNLAEAKENAMLDNWTLKVSTSHQMWTGCRTTRRVTRRVAPQSRQELANGARGQVMGIAQTWSTGVSVVINYLGILQWKGNFNRNIHAGVPIGQSWRKLNHIFLAIFGYSTNSPP